MNTKTIQTTQIMLICTFFISVYSAALDAISVTTFDKVFAYVLHSPGAGVLRPDGFDVLIASSAFILIILYLYMNIMWMGKTLLPPYPFWVNGLLLNLVILIAAIADNIIAPEYQAITLLQIIATWLLCFPVFVIVPRLFRYNAPNPSPQTDHKSNNKKEQM